VGEREKIKGTLHPPKRYRGYQRDDSNNKKSRIKKPKMLKVKQKGTVNRTSVRGTGGKCGKVTSLSVEGGVVHLGRAGLIN